MPTWKRCPCGQGTYLKEPPGQTCIVHGEPCEWHVAIAVLVYAATWILDSHAHFDMLDAVATVLRERARQRREMNRALRDGERETREAARDSYAEGYERAKREEW
jgi:hypothetical protein